MYIEADPSIEGIWRIARSPDWPAPHLVVVGGTHGDEPCGLQALQKLREAAQDGTLPAFEGTLVLLHGNPEATRQGRRFTEGGTDLNRLFDFAFEQQLSRDHWSYEHERAQMLRPLLEQASALLDLHSTSQPTPPFVIATELEGSARLADALGCEFAVKGWIGPGMLGDRVMLAPLDVRHAPSVAVECGAHTAADAGATAHRVALAFLKHMGGQPADTARPRWLRLHDAVRKPSSEFRFTESWRGFQRLEAGTVLGQDAMLELKVRAPGFIVMPNDRVPVGGDMAYLAREET